MGYMLFESLLALVNVSIYLVNGLLNFLDLFQLPLHQLWIPSLRHLFFLIIESIIFEYLFFLMLFDTLLTILFQLLFFFSFLNRSLLASIFNSFLLSWLILFTIVIWAFLFIIFFIVVFWILFFVRVRVFFLRGLFKLLLLFCLFGCSSCYLGDAFLSCLCCFSCSSRILNRWSICLCCLLFGLIILLKGGWGCLIFIERHSIVIVRCINKLFLEIVVIEEGQHGCGLSLSLLKCLKLRYLELSGLHVLLLVLTGKQQGRHGYGKSIFTQHFYWQAMPTYNYNNYIIVSQKLLSSLIIGSY